jgi:hypothetical protein
LFKEDHKRNDITPKNEVSKLQGNYKPTTSGEAKLLKKIDELNKIKEDQEISMIGRKHTNKSEIIRKSSKHVTEEDIWCAKCRQWHDKDVHKPLFENPKFSKAVNSIITQKDIEPLQIKKTLPNTKLLSGNTSSNTHQIYSQVQKSSNSNKYNETINSNQKLKNHNEIMNKIKQQIRNDKPAASNNLFSDSNSEKYPSNNNY